MRSPNNCVFEVKVLFWVKHAYQMLHQYNKDQQVHRTSQRTEFQGAVFKNVLQSVPSPLLTLYIALKRKGRDQGMLQWSLVSDQFSRILKGLTHISGSAIFYQRHGILKTSLYHQEVDVKVESVMIYRRKVGLIIKF